MKITIGADEEADILIFTRSTVGADFHILDESKKDLVPNVSVKHTGADDDAAPPTRYHLTAPGKIQGPVTFKVKGTSTGSMFSSTERYLVVSNVNKKD